MAWDYRIVYKVGDDVRTEVVQKVVFSDMVRWFEEHKKDGYELISALRI